MQKKLGQQSFADGLVKGGTNFLSEVDGWLDWRVLERESCRGYTAPKRVVCSI